MPSEPSRPVALLSDNVLTYTLCQPEPLCREDVERLVAIARWANVLREVVVDHLKNEDARLAVTKKLVAKAITREEWMNHGDVTDRRRKAIEANMRNLLARVTTDA